MAGGVPAAFFPPPAGDVPAGWSDVPKTVLRAVEGAMRIGVTPQIQPVVDALVAGQAFVFNKSGVRYDLKLEIAVPRSSSKFVVKPGWREYMAYTAPVYMQTALTRDLVSVGTTKIDFAYLDLLSKDDLYANIRHTMIEHNGVFLDLDTREVNGMDTEVWAVRPPSLLMGQKPVSGVLTLRQLKELNPQLYVKSTLFDKQVWEKTPRVTSLSALAKRVVLRHGTYAQRDFLRTSDALARVPTYFCPWLFNKTLGHVSILLDPVVVVCVEHAEVQEVFVQRAVGFPHGNLLFPLRRALDHRDCHIDTVLAHFVVVRPVGVLRLTAAHAVDGVLHVLLAARHGAGCGAPRMRNRLCGKPSRVGLMAVISRRGLRWVCEGLKGPAHKPARFFADKRRPCAPTFFCP
jgi:hypothetical protein